MINSQGRTIIVAEDGTGEFIHIVHGVNAADTGDTVLVMPGDYLYEGFIYTDPGVVIISHHPGEAVIWLDWGTAPINLRSNSELHGFMIIGNPGATGQNMVVVQGDSVKIYNCSFDAYARYGYQISITSPSVAPTIQFCHFDLENGNPNDIIWHRTAVNMWMPNNAYGNDIADTSTIHVFIQDCLHDSTVGCVFVTPVWTGFQWLAVDEPLVHSQKKAAVSAYPNPFNATTALSFSLSHTSPVSLTIFNVLGQVVYQANLGTLNAGEHRQVFDARELPSGVYLARVQAEEFSQMRKMVLLK